MINNYKNTSEPLINLNNEELYDSKSNNIDNVFAYLFGEDTLTEKNSYLFVFLESKLDKNKLNEINEFINHDAISDLHKSLLKTSIILVENINDTMISIDKISTAYNNRCVY